MIYIQCVEFHVYTLSFYVFFPVVLNLTFVLDLFFLLDDKIGGALLTPNPRLCSPKGSGRVAGGGWGVGRSWNERATPELGSGCLR